MISYNFLPILLTLITVTILMMLTSIILIIIYVTTQPYKVESSHSHSHSHETYTFPFCLSNPSLTELGHDTISKIDSQFNYIYISNDGNRYLTFFFDFF